MSPIKGLTEKRRLPRIGKIHLGIMVQNEQGIKYPKATDYFVFPTDHPQREELVKLFGEKPRELRVMFPLEDEDKFASQYYRAYSRSRGLTCKGDGTTAFRMVDTETGDMADKTTEKIIMKEVTCEGKKCPDYQAHRCSELMNLQFFLPEVSGLGVWQIDTGSINSIMNINAALDVLHLIYKRVSFVPVILSLEHKEVTNPDDGKKKKIWMLNIRSVDNMIQAAINARIEPLKLVAGITEDLQPDEVLETPESDREVPEVTVGNYDRTVVPGDTAISKNAEAPASADAIIGSGFTIDRAFLNEAKKALKWDDNVCKSFLAKYKVYTQGTLDEVISRLTREQAEQFTKELSEKLASVKML